MVYVFNTQRISKLEPTSLCNEAVVGTYHTIQYVHLTCWFRSCLHRYPSFFLERSHPIHVRKVSNSDWNSGENKSARYFSKDKLFNQTIKMVYLKDWEDFEIAAESMFMQNPGKCRFTLKYIHSKGLIQLKFTDNIKVSRFPPVS